jgi:hypothetical protein
MKKKRTLASSEMTEKLLQNTDLVQEYVEYLRLKVKRNADGAYYCGASEADGYKCWDKTGEFCKEKGLHFATVVDAFIHGFGCESNVANSFDLDAFRKETEEGRKEVTNLGESQKAPANSGFNE